nr:homology with N-terminus of Rhizobium nodD gene [Mesorhizobium loti]
MRFKGLDLNLLVVPDWPR